LFPSEIEETATKTLEINDRMYRVLIKHLKVVGEEDSSFEMYHVNDEQVLYNAYFFDITKETQLAIKNENQKAVVSLLYIDNYEEVIHSIEDVRRPLMVALIDRHVNKFAKQVDGVLRKFEKDKYILIFQKKHLPKLKDDKFSILDTVREIDIGNELPVTLSIGIGLNEYSYVQSLEFARMAIDLALGRGGDQAVIKNNDKFSFYGGKAKGVEKTTRVKARIKAYAFRELIEEADKIIILGHRGQDLDCLGAAVGVYACCKLFGKPAHIVLNEVTTSINVLYDRIIEEGNHPDDLFIKGTEALGYMNENTLLVVVDVNRPSYTENPELLNYVKNVVVFDHHRASTEPILNPVLSYIEPYASSTCEMVTEILRYISDKVKLDPVEADALFAGISVDTKNFVVKAGVKTFEAAAFLRRNGADVTRVRSFFKNDMASYQAKAAAVRDAELYGEEIAISVSPSDVSNPTLVAAQAADELLNIAGIKASFVLTSVNGTIYISARSADNINVQVIMEEMNGGGHMNMAGAQVKEATVEETTLMLKKAIDTYFEKGDE
jgi:c-di-AMP phosphodiesterase-like protein